jgi:hypothetical protein
MRFSKVNVGNLKYSFIVSLIYVGTGTLGLLGMSVPSLYENALLSLLISLINLITMPVCFWGFGLLYGGGRESWPEVLIAQFVVFLGIWFIVYCYRQGSAQKIRRE